jgi:hypothetical protein
MNKLRKITAVSEILKASNKNTYVNLSFGASIEDGQLKPSEVRAFFADEELLAQIEIGMEMIVEPIKEKA